VTSGPAVSKASEIRQQLDRILASPVFNQSVRMSRFLRFVVERSLENRAAELKETTIAIAVFDRDPSYNPKTDPVVRNEARRLRGKLEQYYSGEGQNDSLLISLPKGGYVPSFDLLSAKVEPEDSAPVLPAFPVARPRHLWVGVALAACGIFFGSAYLLLRSHSTAFAAIAVDVAPITSYAGQEFAPSISPDGKRIAFVWDGAGGNYDIYQKAVSGPAQRLTTSPDHDLRPAWSPDGRQIAFIRIGQWSTSLMVMSSDGGQQHEIRRLRGIFWKPDPMEAVTWPNVCWSKDGAWLIVSDRSEGEPGTPLYLVSAASRESRRLTDPSVGENDGYPAVSPDGSTLAFVRTFSHSASEVFIMPPAGGPPRRLITERQDIRGLSWLPDSRHLVFSSNRNGSYGLWILGIDDPRLRLIPTAGESATDPVVAADGKWLVYTDSSFNSNIWRAELGKMEFGASFIASSRQNHSVQYSPDGRKVAFVSDRSGSWQMLDGSRGRLQPNADH
jgi:Tol biopolymer transport system component